jgi:hypothetical protein
MTPTPFKRTRWAISVLVFSLVAFVMFAYSFIPDTYGEWFCFLAACLVVGLALGTAAEWAARRG